METQDSVQNALPAPLKDSVAPSIENRTTDAALDLVVDGIRSSPPVMPDKPLVSLDAVHRSPEDKGSKSDSEAETIVLPGKDGYSPSKTRKTIKHEDQSEEGEIREDNEIRDGLAELKRPNVPSSGNMYSSLGKRKRPKQGKSKEDQAFVGNSSGLSSVPTSPAASRPKTGKNDSDHSRSPSPHALPRKANSVDIVPPRQTVQDVSSGDEGEARKRKRQQSVGGGIESSTKRQQDNHRTSKSQPKSSEKARKHTRSESPPPRTHRRISSAQNSSGVIHGLSHKKKKVPAPLLATRDHHTTDYHSDESSASGSPHPRSSRLRKLATPATAESSHSSTMPPGKSKNRRDGIGRTPLARACATDDFNVAKEILDASLEDLNTADNAGNTPLQIACLEGHADVVKLLIDHGCDIHCVNTDKDTPLLDAVENGHLDVVKLLINAGVNPRRGNVKGEEPLDRLPDMEISEEIRATLIAARLRSSEIRRPSEDLSTHDNDDRSSRGTDSPRHSPPMQAPEDSYPGRKRWANIRSTKTSNKLLHQSMDIKTLRSAAEVGDTETVNRILQVRDNMADTESLVLACRGGHEDVIQLLLAIGGADADPAPLPSRSKYSLDAAAATPMLAAIGREKVEVVKLLLDQPNFDPSKTYKGETYFEIARRRQGSRWQEEEEILREAYEKYTGGRKQISARPRSPEVRRNVDRNEKRSNERVETTSPSQRPKVVNPGMSHNDLELKQKSSGGTIDGAKHEPMKNSPTDTQANPGLKKSDKHKKEEHLQSTQLSGGESTRLGPPRTKSVKKRSESDTPHPSSDNDPVKPRRKLISGKELKGEKEKQRRESIASTAPNNVKDRSESKIGDSNKTDSTISKSTPGTTSNQVEPDLGMDKVRDRSRTLKRDDSKDRLGAIRGESPSKRPRESSTPPRAGSQDSTRTAEDIAVPAKKRRLDSESHTSSSPDNRTNPSLLSSENGRSKSSSFVKERHRQGSMASQGHGKSSEGHAEAKKNPSQNKRLASSPSSQDKHSRPAEKIPNLGVPFRSHREPNESKESAKAAERKAADEREAKIKAGREERSRQEAEKVEAERKRLEAEKAAAEKTKRLEAERAEAEERALREAQAKLEEERLRQQRAETERQAVIAEKRAREEEQARRELEAKLKQEEADRKERQAREDAEARQRAEEENRRIYLEQEQKKREEAERKRAAREAEALAERERQESERRAKLPQLLQSFETYPSPQTTEFASVFKEFWGIRYDTMVYDATGPEAKELWILNTQVAFLLGLNDKHDLQLSRFTGWDRVPASNIAKNIICRLEGDRYACTAPALRFLNPEGRTKGMRTQELRNNACHLFMNMDLFFVKLSDFLYMVPNYPHLRNIKMSVRYKELPKPDGSAFEKWKEEPDAGPFFPQRTYYLNGQFVSEDKPTIAQGRSTPFPRSIPMAPLDPENGLLRLSTANPRYLEQCRAQGLWHLLPAEEREVTLSNGNGNGRPFTSNGNGATMNGSFTPSPSAPSESGKSQPQVMEDSYGSPRFVNGINGDAQQ